MGHPERRWEGALSLSCRVHEILVPLADATSHLLSLLALLGFIVLPNSLPLKKVKNSHKLECLKEVDFSVFSPAAGP